MKKKILRIVRDVPLHWVGDGFPVRSLFSYREGATFDPFLLLDYGGPYEFEPAEAKRGVGEHPHRGFETVTIVYQGELEHRDSSGSRGSIGPGDVQWMTAASGVVHEELHSKEFTKNCGMFEMIQLWVNLPAKEKLSTPRYQGIVAAEIPWVPLAESAGKARVIAGELIGTHGPASTFTPINVWDLQLNKGGKYDLPIPSGHTSMLVVQQGELLANDEPIKAVELALFEREGDSLSIQAETPARVLVLTGEPLGEPVVGEGPFVMNTREQIREAIQDYKAGRMGRLT
ncbi:pirin family protein [Bythopirellula polymerisocia]|uniref:Quercetin 2,3-dioxygenase n=1 Tax=Bythopirellula polymerisocia TaxID=2528003 RepID=A0A5C6CP12_9BACT|nr:pirin family protein [Bythopirellula polymerisocia]TWU24479.1 Quercetin 2,3-dioxygenase [Bythopirellula polymerisocia]